MGKIDWSALIIGTGALTVGFKTLAAAFRGANNSLDQLEAKQSGGRPCPGDGRGGMHCRILDGGPIEQRARYIAQHIINGSLDPRIRRLAVQTLSKKCDGDWCTPPRDHMAELGALASTLSDPQIVRQWRALEGHFAWVKENVRYTKDHAYVDQFQSPRRTVEFGGGDCLPEDTLLYKFPGTFVTISQIEVGDHILDGEKWVAVVNKWDKGILGVREFHLNNGCVLRCTDEHRLFVVPRQHTCPGDAADAEEMEAKDVDIGDDLLQPRDPIPCGRESLSEEDALIVGAYIAEGWRDGNRVCIAGVPNGKGLRERVVEAAKKSGHTFSERPREIRFGKNPCTLIDDCGRGAINKRLPTMDLKTETVEIIVGAMNQGDGGVTGTGTLVYSTISPVLALQYRMLQRMLGVSVHIKRVVEHGGLGKNPIYRITVRPDFHKRPWAKVRAISDGGEQHCYDIQTESGRIYLPESDVITHNCDDHTSLFGALALASGFPVGERIYQTVRSPDYDHIAAVVEVPPRSGRWVVFDASVDEVRDGRRMIAVYPGWGAPPRIIRKYVDFIIRPDGTLLRKNG